MKKLPRILLSGLAGIGLGVIGIGLAPVSGEALVIGDCADYDCTELLTELQQRWPENLEPALAECPSEHTLGLSVWGDEGKRNVLLACWEPPAPEAGASGSRLILLPYPGEEANLGVSWDCWDEACPALETFKAQEPETFERYNFQCRTYGGSINFLSSESESNKFDVQCYFQAGVSLWDSNGDGVSDGENSRGAGVDIILGTFVMPPAE